MPSALDDDGATVEAENRCCGSAGVKADTNAALANKRAQVMLVVLIIIILNVVVVVVVVVVAERESMIVDCLTFLIDVVVVDAKVGAWIL